MSLCCLPLTLVSGPGCLGPWRFVFLSNPPHLVFILFLFSSVVRPCCLWLSLVSSPGCPRPWRCVLFVLLVRRFSAPHALSLLLCCLPGRWLLPGGCCPPPPLPFRFSRLSSLPLGACLFFLPFARSAPACWLGARRRFSPSAAAPPPFSCFLCWPRAARVSLCSCCFCVSRPAVGCSLVVAAPPPLLCLAVFVAATWCSVFFFCCFALACLLGARRRFWPSAAPPLPSCCLFCWSPAARLPMCCRCFFVSLLAVGCSLVVAAPPAPSVSRGFRRCPLVLRFFSSSSAALLVPACLALIGGSRHLLTPPPQPGACTVPCAVWCCRAALPFLQVFCGAVWLCSACLRCGLLSDFGLRCRVLCCAVCPWVPCCAALLRFVPLGVVLLCAVLFCCARWVPLLVVPCPLALPVALGPCALRRCVLRCSPVLCALCCVCFVVACCCVLLFAAVLCAVCVLGCRAVRSLSSLLCAVLCFAVLVRLRCAVCVVRAAAGAWCCGALLCVVLFPLLFCGAVLGLVSRGCLLVACLGVGVPVGSRGLLFWGWCLLLWCPSSLCRVCCAVLLCCRMVLCCCALQLFCGAVCVCFALLWPVVRRRAVLCALSVVCGVFCPVVASVCCGALSLPAVACSALLPVFSPTSKTTTKFVKMFFLAFENKIKIIHYRSRTPAGSKTTSAPLPYMLHRGGGGVVDDILFGVVFVAVVFAARNFRPQRKGGGGAEGAARAGGTGTW